MRHAAPRADYTSRVSDAASDPAWDAFLAATPGGHHVQTSVWGQIKRSQGWNASRIVVRDRGEIVAGAQILERPLAVAAIGYVPKGPVVARDDPALIELVLAEIRRVAKERRIVHLTVQPPNLGPDIAGYLGDAGFEPGDVEVAPTASVQLSLEPELDAILAGMKKNHRRYIRFGQRQGMTGRRGTRDDLPLFYRLLEATAHRQGFTPYPLSYFETIWDLFHPSGSAQLFLTEYEGETVSAQLVIGFGDTVITKNSGWSGDHSRLGPNHVLEWTTIQWAKSEGYRIYDLEGIDPPAARALAAGEKLTQEMTRRPFFWKLGFGGKAVLFPEPYVYVRNPVLRKLYFVVYPRIARNPLTARLIGRIRTR